MRAIKLIKAICLIAVLGVSGIQAVHAQEYKKITRLGTSQSVCPGGIQTADQLQEFFAQNPAAVRQIVSDAGWNGSADALIAAVAAGDFTRQAYPIGTRLQWTGAQKNGRYLAHRYREWAGKQSFPAFQVMVRNGCEVHEIAIPLACCNVSLVGITDSDAAECQPQAAAPVVAPAPVVEAPAEKKANPLALIPFIGAFAGTETRPRFEFAWEQEFRDSSGILGLRAGLLKNISPKTSIFGQVSFYSRQGVNVGNDFPEENFALDVGLEHRLSQRAFIGGGIGIWDIDDSDFSETSLFAHVGGDIGKTNLQWILEGRVFDSDSETLDSISNNRAFSAGLRYVFK